MKQIKMRYLWEGKWYFIDFLKDNLHLKFKEFENRAKTTFLEIWTGLLDKNGKEIYDGDIVKIESGKSLKIIWKGGGYYAYSNEKSLFNQPRVIPRITESQCNRYEVVGNIYENPELLEEDLK